MTNLPQRSANRRSKPEYARSAIDFILCGEPRWRSGAEGGPLTEKSALMVSFVAVKQTVSRTEFEELLWTSRDDNAKARTRSRQLVDRLRRRSLHEVFRLGETVTFAQGVSCDIHTPVEQWSLNDLMAYKGFLAGIEPLTRKSKTWLEEERRKWRESVGDALIRHAEKCTDQQLDDALAAAKRAVDLVPNFEAAHRCRISLFYRSGDTFRASDAASEMKSGLAYKSERDLSRETLNLLRTIKLAAKEQPRRPTVPESLFRPPRLIGRHRQMAMIGAAWASNRPFLICGNAGVGKSRLLNDFVGRAKFCVSVECRRGDEDTPYSVLGNALRRLADQSWGEPPSALKAVLASLVDETNWSLSGTAVDEDVLRRAIESWLKLALANGLQGFTFDDLQNSDLASVQTLRWLSAKTSLRMLRLGFAARPMSEGAVARELGQWEAESTGPQVVELRSLTIRQLRELLASLQLPEEIRSLDPAVLSRSCAGVPYRVLEYLRHSILNKAKVDGAVPDSGSADRLTTDLISEMPEVARDLLRLLAVLGSRVSPRLAATALGNDESEVVAWIDRLEADGFLDSGRFAHDLSLGAVLSGMPPDVLRHWHACAAQLLVDEGCAQPARVGAHWYAAERWAEAGTWLRAAAQAACRMGRLSEHVELAERAAFACEAAGDAEGQFEALLAPVQSVFATSGPGAVAIRLPRLRQLATTSRQRTQVAIAEAEVLVNMLRHSDREVLTATERAVGAAAAHADLLAGASSLHGAALAQRGHFARAVFAHRRAARAAAEAGQASARLNALSSLSYVYYEAGRLREAIEATRRSIDLAREVDDEGSLGQLEGNLATLLLSAGDPRSSIAIARRARRQQTALGAGVNGPIAGMTLAALGAALIFVGEFAEAAAALSEALDILGPEGLVGIRAKVQLVFAQLYLLCGEPDHAGSMLWTEKLDQWPAPMQLQWNWAQARVHSAQGLDSGVWLENMARIHSARPNRTLAQTAWLEWSHQGRASVVIKQMTKVRVQYVRGGMLGSARSTTLRIIDRLGESGSAVDHAKAARLADRVRDEISTGLHVSAYAPEAWLILARAYDRVDRQRAARRCIRAAAQWIDASLPRVPAELREGFLTRNRVNVTVQLADERDCTIPLFRTGRAD